MYIVKIQLINVGILPNQEQNAGQINVIEGRIGSGKTTFVDAIINVLTGGNDKSLIKHGEKEASIEVTYNDGVRLVKKLGEGGFEWEIYGPDGNKITNKTASYIDQLRNLDSVNASNFIDGDDKERIKILIDAWGITLNEERLSKIAGTVKYKRKDNPIDTLASLKDALYDERTGINRLEEQNRIAAKKIIETLPPVSEISHTEQLAALRLKKSSAEKEKDLKRSEALKKRDDQLSNLSEINGKVLFGFKSDHDKELNTVNTEYDKLIRDLNEQIRKLNEKRDTEIRELNAAHEKLVSDTKATQDPEIAKIRAECDSTLTAIMQEFDDTVSPITTEIASLEQQSINSAVTEKQRSIAQEYIATADKYLGDAKDLTDRLGFIEEWKQEMLQGFPGLDIIEGVVHIENELGEKIPWKRVNDGKKIQLALQIAQMLAGEIKVICMNGMEAIDPENFEIMKEELRRTSPQYFFTRVESIDLKFTAIPREAQNIIVPENELVTA